MIWTIPSGPKSDKLHRWELRPWILGPGGSRRQRAPRRTASSNRLSSRLTPEWANLYHRPLRKLTPIREGHFTRRLHVAISRFCSFLPSRFFSHSQLDSENIAPGVFRLLTTDPPFSRYVLTKVIPQNDGNALSSTASIVCLLHYGLGRSARSLHK